MQHASQVSADAIERVTLTLEACSQAIRQGDSDLLQEQLTRLISSLQALDSSSVNLKLDSQAKAGLIHSLADFKQVTGFQQLQLGRQLNILQKQLQVLIPNSPRHSTYNR